MDPDIAPLAQRLAEENNVDWRKLSGTGTDGRIVERDVLDYLAKVMAGEADVDPTPEPLPEGVERWTDEEGRPIDAPGATGHQQASAETEEAPGSAAGPEESGDEDLLLAGDDLLVGDDDTKTDASSLTGDAPDLFASEETPSEDEPGAASEAPDLFVGGEEADDLGGSGDATFDFGGFPGSEAAGEPAAEETGSEESDEAGGMFAFEEPTAYEDDERYSPAGGVEPVAAEPAATEPVTDGQDLESAQDDEQRHEAADVQEESVQQVVAPLPTPRGEPRDEPTIERSSTAPDGWPLARVRTVLRRHVDLGGVLAVRRSVALESGRDDVPSVAVLLCAARFAAARLAFERPGVAYPDGAGDIAALVPSATGLAGLAAEIDAALRDGSARNDDADLWVADLSGLGADEAVLDGDLPQLLLGRTLSDAEDGSSHATVSLASDLPADRAAEFLSRVAALLEDPLRLLA